MRDAAIELLVDEAAYRRLWQEKIVRARKYVLAESALFKQLRTRYRGKLVPAIHVAYDLAARRGIEFRMIFAGKPTTPALQSLLELPAIPNFQFQLCAREHAKTVLIDGCYAYVGSANWTNAGLGFTKGSAGSNHELGVGTSERWLIEKLEKEFCKMWDRVRCRGCRKAELCRFEHEGVAALAEALEGRS